jgi:hypothetical protein
VFLSFCCFFFVLCSQAHFFFEQFNEKCRNLSHSHWEMLPGPFHFLKCPKNVSRVFHPCFHTGNISGTEMGDGVDVSGNIAFESKFEWPYLIGTCQGHTLDSIFTCCKQIC